MALICLVIVHLISCLRRSLLECVQNQSITAAACETGVMYALQQLWRICHASLLSKVVKVRSIICFFLQLSVVNWNRRSIRLKFTWSRVSLICLLLFKPPSACKSAVKHKCLNVKKKTISHLFFIYYSSLNARIITTSTHFTKSFLILCKLQHRSSLLNNVRANSTMYPCYL